LGGADRSDAVQVSQAGSEGDDNGLQVLAVGLQRAGGIAQRERETPYLGQSHGLLAVGVAWSSAPSQADQDGLGERTAGGLAVSIIITAEQQGAQPIDLLGDGGGELVAGAE
jgi:hypothetical protein